VFVPPPFAADAILEGVDAELDLVVAITEGIPVRDMVRVKRAMAGRTTRLIGPNCPGLVDPGLAVRTSPPAAAASASLRATSTRSGHVGVVSRSGTLTYEAVYQLDRRRHRPVAPASASAATRSTAPRTSTSSRLFNDDPDTHGIIMIGEIGGNAEVEAAALDQGSTCRSPSRASSPGPPLRRVAAWATPAPIVGGAEDTAAAKIADLPRVRHLRRGYAVRHGRRPPPHLEGLT
jgi:succinyl-CoA synthetase alpha subunit